MKLSEIKGERTIDVIAEIIEPVINIAEDNEAVEIFERKPLPEGMTAKQFITKRLKTGLPKLLKNHKSDIITIIATIDGVEYSEYAENLNLATLMRDCVDLITDDAFMVFFKSAQNGETPSADAPLNTTDEA